MSTQTLCVRRFLFEKQIVLKVELKDDRIHVGERFSFTLQRTLRLPDDGKAYPLPPGFGPFPVLSVSDYEGRFPGDWSERGGFFVPLYQREALWLQFEGARGKPNAVMVSTGEINAVSGETRKTELSDDPQNYIVCPDQPWLDGINIGDGLIRQFVATTLGRGDTIEEQLTGSHQYGGLQLRVFEPRPGKFSNRQGAEGELRFDAMYALGGPAMGIAAGGRMQQKIYPDQYGIETWDPKNSAEVLIHLVNSEQYLAITNREPPPSPVSAQLYTNMHLPWFRLYDEDRADVRAPENLKSVKTLKERELNRDGVDDENESVLINPYQVIGLSTDETGE